MQASLGSTFLLLGERERETKDLTQAIAVFRKALEQVTADQDAIQWGEKKANLGVALARLGDRNDDVAMLQQAVEL